MSSISKADVEALARRRVSQAAPRESAHWHPGFTGFELWCPGRLRNPLNGSWSYKRRIAWRNQWHDKVAQALLVLGWRQGYWPPAQPKVVTLTAHVLRRFDQHDGLPAALKAVPDALVRCWVLHNDSVASGHMIEYAPQVLDRANPGVRITVTLREGETR